MSKVFVTGIGLISSLGDSVESNRTALLNGLCGLSSLDLFESKYASLLPFGEIKISTERLKELLGITNSGVTRTSLLALHACKDAIQDSKLSTSELKSQRTAIVAANTVGGMCLTDELHRDANRKDSGSAFLSSYDAGSVTIFLQNYFGILGIGNTINTACSSSANVLMHGARLIKNGLADRVIVGGVDSLAKFTINGFNSLHILSNELCTPFDRDRNGLNLGEGAAFLILEKEEACAKKKVYAELSGYCNANDAFHPSSLSDDGTGPFNSMQGALRIAKLEPNQIGYINAHGTATENNDLVESTAMIRLFGKVPPFASTKSYTGHTLGAAGSMEAVFSILSLMYGELYPVLRFKNPIEKTGLTPLQIVTNSDPKHVMSNSFGFGGNCTSLIFSKA